MSDTALAFKRGFAERLARKGLTPSMVERGMDKQAGKLFGAAGALDLASKVPGGLLGAATLFAGLPIVAGGLGGYTAGKMQGAEPPDLKALREEERINNIRRAVKALKRQQEMPL